MQSVFLTAQLQSIENTHTHTQMTYRTHRIIITQVFFPRTSTEHSLIYCVKDCGYYEGRIYSFRFYAP